MNVRSIALAPMSLHRLPGSAASRWARRCSPPPPGRAMSAATSARTSARTSAEVTDPAHHCVPPVRMYRAVTSAAGMAPA